MAEHWENQGANVKQNPGQVQVELGSDHKLRFFGISTGRGKKVFPSALTVTATPAEAGTVVTAHSRDDLGWYPMMDASMGEWAATRNDQLIKTCRKLTTDSNDESVTPPELDDDGLGIGHG